MFHPLRLVLALAMGLMLAFDAMPLLAPGRAEAAQTSGIDKGVRLLMVVRRGCVYCAAWEREIGPLYPNSTEGRRAPLARIDIDGPWPDGLVLDRRPWLTPGFILLRDGHELARIEGYPGADRFFPMLSDMMRQTGVTRK